MLDRGLRRSRSSPPAPASIDANQAGNANYNAAPQVQQSFPVAKGDQTITFTSTAPAGATVGGADLHGDRDGDARVSR